MVKKRYQPQMNSGILHSMLIEAKDNAKMVEMLLLTQKQFINDPIRGDPSGDSILIDIAHRNYETLVLPLIKHGANVNAHNSTGTTALMRAARIGGVNIAITLIENGADVNSADKYGDTALHDCINGSLEIAKRLVKHGADVNRKNNTGRTPLEEALIYGRSTIAQYLKGLNVPRAVEQKVEQPAVQQITTHQTPIPPQFSKVFIERIWPAMSTEQRIDAVNNMSPDELMTIKTTLGAIF